MGSRIATWVQLLVLCSTVLLGIAQERQTTLRGIALNGIALQDWEWDSLAIAPTDTISFAFACRCPQISTPLLFRIGLRRHEDNREQLRSIGLDRVLYTGLPEGTYSLTVQAFAPAEGWYAQPVSFSFFVDVQRAAEWKRIWSQRRRSFRQQLSQGSTPSAPSASTHAGNGWLWWIIVPTFGVTFGILVLLLWSRIRARRRTQATARLAHPSDSKPVYTAQDALLAENTQLKAELSNLRGQVSALEARSRHLQQENKALQEQVEHLSAKQRELERLQEQKDALFAALVHDIKNPASAIRSLVELLRSYDLWTREQQEIITDILGRTTRIVELSQGISRVLVLEAAVLRLDLRPVDVPDIIRSACYRNKPLADRKAIALLREIEPGLPLILADPQRLEEALDNLIGNSIKYSQSGAIVIVRAYAQDGRLHIEVEDNGPGMSGEDIRNAFQRGAWLGAQSTGGELSSGLGLWVVKRLIEAHQGHVRIRSALGKGTTVLIELPLQPTSRPATEASGSH
ncbi:MAG: HAMP domain-containing histidine kinase [Candidatus Kapabacteria bacterium]|nr:HAMP domain-containing histidine kinase [Candidatus Kapabacteria bacterium]MDW8011505.1 HAMP domain-containing sensor histidine kinase [Bacteroidota bacterium]